MNIGEELKKTREAMGIDERYVSEMTHIRREYIIALEENRFDDIDLAPVYKTGFLRIYSKYLKLDADKFVAEYKSLFGPKPLGKGGARSISSSARNISSSDSLLAGEFDGNASVEKSSAKLDVRRLAIYGGSTIVVLAALVFGLVKACSSGTDSSDRVVAGTLASPENQERAYKFELISNVAQNVKIYEDYKGFDRALGKPIYGARVVDQLLAANRKYTFTGRGTLYIEESVPMGVTVTLPNRSVIDSAPAGTTLIDLPSDSKLKTSPKSTGPKKWLATPSIAPRA